MNRLMWPAEQAIQPDHELPVFSRYENLLLDLHGDPVHAGLVVFSDGNHHMALAESLQAFSSTYPDVGEIFYTTTPPGIATEILRAGGLGMGNLRIHLKPHVFISPPAVLAQLAEEGFVQTCRSFMAGRGIAMLVKKGNPSDIRGIDDLLRPEVRLFLSNPVTEKVSYKTYTDCLRRLAQHEGKLLGFLDPESDQFNPEKLLYGSLIHHREAPQAIMDSKADVAVVFYHLALRYQRVFADAFDFIQLDGLPGSQICDRSLISCGLVGNGGKWGQVLMHFLMSDAVTQIYEYHGLTRAK
jgi:hypothetical protein